METAAVLQGLMLCVVLAAHTAQGVPVLRKSGSTPHWPAKPAPHTYVPKRFQRIWAEKQDELMMEGPSGDGPVDAAWDSPLLPGKTSRTHQTHSDDDYATRSPLPEDILPSQSEPFPSIIDTEIESSESLGDEFISRSSVLFHGPSSLLNTLIFRPSMPDESPPSIVPTPTTGSSSDLAQTSLYELSASWTEMDEVASSFRMSSRRALSFSPSEMYAIITAISASYIYQEEPPTAHPSVVESFSSLLPPNESRHRPERVPDQEIASFNISVHLQDSDATYFDISSKTHVLYESYQSVSKIKPSLSTGLFPVEISEALTGSSFDFPPSMKVNISTDELEGSLSHFANLTDASFDLINPSFPLWNSYSTSLEIHTSSLNTEAYYFRNNTLDSSFVESLQSSGMIPLLTPQHTFFLSNVETTVTIIDNKDTPFSYLLPTLTVTGTTFSGPYEIFNSYTEDFSFVPSLENELEVTIFNDFSTFKHLSSSFDTFSTTDSIHGLGSLFSHISMENMISASSSVHENQTVFVESKSEDQVVPKQRKSVASVVTYPYLSMSDLFPDEGNGTWTTSEIPFKSYSVFVTKSLLFNETVLNNTEDFIEEFRSLKTQMKDAQTKMKTTDAFPVNEIESHQQMTIDISSELLPSPTVPNMIFTSVLDHNETLPHMNELFSSLKTSFDTEEHTDSSWKSTEVLSNEITKQANISKSEEETPTHSKDFQRSSSVIEDEIPTDSKDNFLDPSTHHITVRSLKDTSGFDILTKVLLDLSTSEGFDSINVASLHTNLIDETFTPISTEHFVSNLHAISTLPSMSLLPSDALLPELIASSELLETTSFVSSFSNISSDDESFVISRKSDAYFLQSSLIPSKTLYSDSMFQYQNKTYLTSQYVSSYNQSTILTPEQSDFIESLIVDSSALPITYKESNTSDTFLGTSLSVYPSSSWLSYDFEVSKSFKSSISPFETSMEPAQTLSSMSLYTYNQLTPAVSMNEDYSTFLSDLNNHLLESWNASSKALDGTPSLINRNESREIDLKSQSEEIIQLISKISESGLNIFASDFYITPSFPLSSIEDSTFEREEPKRSYFEFHESTLILESDFKDLTAGLFYSSDYVRSAVYDSSETSSDILRDFEVSATPITDFIQPSLQSSLSSLLEPEFPSISLSSEEIISSSFIVPEHSEIKSKIKESFVEFPNDKSPRLSEVIYISEIQQTKSVDIIAETGHVSLLSSAIESSFPEMNTYFSEISLLSIESSPVWSGDLFSTMVKQPRSMDSFMAKHLTESSFPLHLSPEMSPWKESDLTSLAFTSIEESESVETKYTRELPSLFMTPLFSITSLLSEVQTTEIPMIKDTLSLNSDHHELESDYLPFLSSVFSYTSSITAWGALLSLSTKEPSVMESYLPLPMATPIASSMLSSRQPLSVSVLSSSMEPTSVESYFPKPILPPTMSNIFSSEHYLQTSSKYIEPLNIESHHPKLIISSALLTSVLSGYVTPFSAPNSAIAFSSLRIKEPKSIESDEPGLHATKTLTTPILLDSNKYDTVLVNPKEEPKSVDSALLQSKTYFYGTVSQTPVLPHSDFKPHYDTPPVYPKEDPKSIDSSALLSRTFFIRTVSRIPDSSDSAKLLQSPSYTKIKELQSIESDFPKHKVSSSLRSPLFSDASVWSVKPHFESISSTSLRRLESSISGIKPTSVMEMSPVVTMTAVSSTWYGDFSTVPDSTDSVLVSILPISSFLNVNQTKNGSEERGRKDDESGAIPTRNTFLFKDNHYWILTVLEAPATGPLPDNFSHLMENRLANAYSEALRSRMKEGDKEDKDIVVVKILSVTDDILLRQLDIVYVVEKGGSLVPSAIAAELLNSLRFEQLREFLGYHAIEKARPYRPPGGDVSRPMGSPLPVLAIVGGLLLGLLLVGCCICLYCRCCRPKPAPSSPGSSASGTLQRSLSKYGQHNRKHLFREMTHQLTAEMAAQIKHGSTAPEAYLPEKTGRSLPALPRESDDSEKKIDPSMKRLKILENKEASTSPIPAKQSRGALLQSSDTSSTEKKKPPPKPKKRRKVKDSGDQVSINADSVDASKESKPESPPPTPPPKRDVSIPSAGKRHSPDSGTSSRHPSTQPSSSSEKEAESEGSNTELLPPIQDLIDRSKSESEAAAAEAQMHLSRVRQRIAELLDDAFAMAGGRRLYGSLRSKKIEPTSEVLPRFGSFRSQSATGDLVTTKRHGSLSVDRRPISEGGQRLLGVLTDEGQLITHPPPKLVWDQEEGYSVQSIERSLENEVVEARNRNINLFPFQPQRIHQLPALPSSSSLPLLDTLPESRQDASGVSPTHTLREATSEQYLPLSERMNPATGDQFDELDVVSALRNGEPVEALIQAIKDELQKFAGSLPGAEDGESNA